MLQVEQAALRVLADLVALSDSHPGAKFMLSTNAQLRELFNAAALVVNATDAGFVFTRVECQAHAPAFVNYFAELEIRACHICGVDL